MHRPALLLTGTALSLLSAACASNSTPSPSATVLSLGQVQIPPLPDSSRQPATPSECLPTCSAALIDERESWLPLLMPLMPQDSPASGTTTPHAKR